MLLKNTDYLPKKIENYEKIRVIHRGSFGCVYKAKNKLTNKICAVKRLNSTMCYDTNGFSILFLREISILRNVSHENIIELGEIIEGSEINELFLAMEYCDTDLKNFIGKCTNLSTNIITSIFLQVLEGVKYLHEEGILHRDLKPSNILLLKNGTVKIADFGLSREIEKNMTNLVVTLWYRPIEILLGAEEYDQSIDIWSLGCILGEMLIGTPILNGEGEIDQLNKIFHLLGLPKDEDFESLNLPYYKNINKTMKYEPNFNKTFEKSDKKLKDFVKNMLLFNPKARITSQEAILRFKNFVIDKNAISIKLKSIIEENKE